MSNGTSRRETRFAPGAYSWIGPLREVKLRPRHTSSPGWILFPFTALRRLLAWIIGLTGRLVAVVISAGLMLVGGLLCLTIGSTILGIPIAVIGLLIVWKGIF